MSKKPLPIPVEAEAPAPYTPSDVATLQALARGEANQIQQMEGLDWIINHACRTFDQPYRSERPHDTAFAAGRMFAGQQIVKLLKLKLGKLGGEEHG